MNMFVFPELIHTQQISYLSQYNIESSLDDRYGIYKLRSKDGHSRFSHVVFRGFLSHKESATRDRFFF